MPDWRWEEQSGSAHVAGVDEVGRGCLAGAVVAAAVVFRSRASLPLRLTERINDSKRLTAQQRRALVPIIHDHAEVGLGVVDVAAIESLNIHHASLQAMAEAIQALPKKPDVVLVDGRHAPPTAIPCHPIIKGDSQSLSIAAASIIAKVYRDDMMLRLSQRYPQYGWHRNAGYGTAEHLRAMALYGLTPHHRRGFAPVNALLTQQGDFACVS